MQTNQQEEDKTGQNVTHVVRRVEEEKFITEYYSVRYTQVTHFLQIGFSAGGFSGIAANITN